MKSINKYVIIAGAACIMFAQAGFCQTTKSDYFMETSYLRSSLNPALRPDQGYLVVPILPNIGANLQTNKFNLDNLTFKGPEGKRVTFMHQSVDVNDFLSNLSNDNYINMDMNIKLLGLGFYSGNKFWSVDLGVRTHADVNVPKSFFALLKKGFEQDRQISHDLSDLSATGQSFIELGVGHSRSFLKNHLTVGARVKLLGGLADFDLDAKSLKIEAGPDSWKAKSQVTLRGSAPGLEATYDDEDKFDGVDIDGFTISGYGVGFDVGAVYDLNHILPSLNGLKVSFALNDIGFINWSKNNTIHLRSPETEVEITPTDYTYSKDNGSSLTDVLDDAFDDIKEAVNLKEEGERRGRTSMLRMNMNMGVEYEIFKHRLSAGALYSARFGNYFTSSEFTLSVNGRLNSWVSTSVSYGFIHSKFDTFGFALHLAPSSGVNLFLASDYSIPHVSSDFVPTTSKALNFQIGISMPLGKKQSKKKSGFMII